MSAEAGEREAAARLADPVIWSDVENGAYAADLALWEELAGVADGSILELGCGSGRVALHLARRGREIVAMDIDPLLVAAVKTRARDQSLAVEAVVGDVRSLELGRRFELVIAPMQLAHLISVPSERVLMLRSVAAQLEPGGVAAFAVLDREAAAESNYAADVELVPDMLEDDGWVYSSLPTEVRAGAEGGIEVLRTRQVVSPDGALVKSSWAERLAAVEPEEFEAAATAAGLVVGDRRAVAATDAHVGSTVVMLSAR